MRPVMQHNFAQVDTPKVPHSVFDRTNSHLTTLDADYLVPFMWDDIIPGDSFHVQSNFLIRFNDLIHPYMDNVYFDTFYFFVPYRLIWDDWVKMCGEQKNPGDSIDYSVPQVGVWCGLEDSAGWSTCKPGSLADYFGVPVSHWCFLLRQANVPTSATRFACKVNALPFRAYRLIWNEWFRDENLQDSVEVNTSSSYESLSEVGQLLKRGKRHDYFTSSLPWPQKGPAVSFSFADKAPVGISGVLSNTSGTAQVPGFFPLVGSYYRLTDTPVVDTVAMYNFGANAVSQGFASGTPAYFGIGSTGFANGQVSTGSTTNPQVVPPYHNTGDAGKVFASAYADLSQASMFTINQMREAFAIQRIYERDARGGTRYTELLQSHFGVINPDARLQRPEYLGGSSTILRVQSVPQTSASTSASSQANLAAYSVTPGHDGFYKTFGEYGILIGLCSIRADLRYQQGLPRFFRKKSRFDFYWPALCCLGEQAVLNSEIYCDTNVVNSTSSAVENNGFLGEDDLVFGYQERYAEYRYKPSMITGYMNSEATGSPDSGLDAWHLAQHFANRPVLNSSFIESNTPISRVKAVKDLPAFLMEVQCRMKCARPMPVMSVPGLIDHF